ncbi:MARC1 [Bugula neritina]|uniref:MARC1 n=1 Tax=Bugula neritina TaxID=10212 RepID=A0A7J7JCG4_BUGNE|nr:MARC1 [Bugula neritina]
MMSTPSREMTGALVLGAGMLLVAGYVLYKRKSKSYSVGKLSQLILYPIKSGPPMHVQSAECLETGLKYKQIYDRQFALIGKRTFISIRTNLRLLKLKINYDEDTNSLILEAPTMTAALSIPLQVPEYDPSKVKSFMWYDNRETLYFDYGDTYSKWLSEFLEEECRLGYAHPEIVREINPEMVYNHTAVHPDSKILFSNTHPFMIATQASLDDLNERLEDKVTMDSFRPNFVITGEGNSVIEPYIEDSWREICVGPDAVLYNSRSCPRCPMIYVDYDNHKMRDNKEPMTTLLRYRRGTVKKDKSKTVFGINVTLIKHGRISVGDKFVAAYATA